MKLRLPTRSFLLLAVSAFSGVSSTADASPAKESQPTELRAPRIVAPLVFIDGTVGGSPSPEQRANLLTRKVKPANEDWTSFLVIQGEGYQDTPTIASYRAARNRGAAPWGTLDEVAQLPFLIIDQTLKFLELAQPSPPPAQAFSLLDLPVNVLRYNRPEEQEPVEQDAAAGKTLRSYRSEGKLSHFKAKPASTLEFEDSPCGYKLVLLAAGDINHDGFQDHLVSSLQFPLEGMSNNHEILVVLAPPPGKFIPTIQHFSDFTKPAAE